MDGGAATPVFVNSAAVGRSSRRRARSLSCQRMWGHTREAAIRPNSVTPQRTRNDRIAASDTAKQSVDHPDHDKLTDLVLEMAAEASVA